MGDFWRGSHYQPIFDTKCFMPARFAVPDAPSFTALSRHDSHSSLPSCLPSGGCLTHQCIASQLIHVFFNGEHFSNMVFTIFLFKCSDCTLWRSGTASLTIGTRNLQEEGTLWSISHWHVELWVSRYSTRSTTTRVCFLLWQGWQPIFDGCVYRVCGHKLYRDVLRVVGNSSQPPVFCPCSWITSPM